MKSYTDLEQSKKLAKILPIESADMAWYSSYTKEGYSIRMLNDTYPLDIIGEEHDDIPAWSLAALVNFLPFHVIVDNQIYSFSAIKGLDKNGETYAIKYAIFNTTFYLHLTDYYNNPIDACYEMVLKLNELNLL